MPRSVTKRNRPVNPQVIDQGGVEDFLISYVETALWSTMDESDDNGGDPLDRNYGLANITNADMATIRSTCRAFIADNMADIDGRYIAAGNDFWLTRNGHGAGFWDGGWPRAAGERLTKASKAYGSVDLYVNRSGYVKGW